MANNRCNEELNSTKLRVLRTIKDNKGRPTYSKDLQRALKLNKGTMCSILKCLEANGYIKQDRTSKPYKISITEEGLITGMRQFLNDVEISILRSVKKVLVSEEYL